MRFLRKNDEECYWLASLQAKAFERSVVHGLPSYYFIQSFMNSPLAEQMDRFGNRVSDLSVERLCTQTAGRMPIRGGKVIDPSVLHWMGFFYRSAAYMTGVSSKKLFRQIPPNYLVGVYPAYHAVDIEKAVQMVFADRGVDTMTPTERFFALYRAGIITLNRP